MDATKNAKQVTFESFFDTTLRLFFYDRLNPYILYRRPLAPGWPTTRAQLQRHFMHFSLIYVVLGQVTQIFLGFMRTGDVITASESLAYSVIGTICIFVSWTFNKRTQEMYEIIKHLQQMYPKDNRILEKINVREILTPLKIVMTIFRTCYYVTLGFKYVAPLIETVNGYMKNGELDLRLPLHVWYPFDAHRPVLVVIIFVFESWGAALSTTPMPIVTTMIGGITSAFCVQFKLLAHEFNNLKPRGRDTEKLKQLIKRHCVLINLSEEIKEMFSAFLLGNYILCSIGYALFLFVVTFSDKQAVVIEYAGCCICFVFYISTVSMFGHTYMENVRKRARV